MRILLLGNAASIHTVKWINGLASRGHEVHLATQDDAAEHRISDEVTVHRMRHGGGLGYFRNSGQLRRPRSNRTWSTPTPPAATAPPSTSPA